MAETDRPYVGVVTEDLFQVVYDAERSLSKAYYEGHESSAPVVPDAIYSLRRVMEARGCKCHLGGNLCEYPHRVVPPAPDEADKAVALKVVREIDAAFESSERLRLGRWALPDEREQTIATFIAAALAQAREQTWEKAIETAKADRQHHECKDYENDRLDLPCRYDLAVDSIVEALESASKVERE